MSKDEGQTPLSFDPKSWVTAPGAAPAEPRPLAGAPSDNFDPSTWIRRDPDPQQPPSPPKARPDRRLFLALGGGVVAAGAAGGFFLTRKAGPRPATPSAMPVARATVVPPTAPQPTPGLVTRVAQGRVEGADLFASAVAKGLNDTLVPVFTKALSYDIDFAREVGPGDMFTAVIEERVDAAEAPTGERRLLFAGFEHFASAESLSEELGVATDRQKAAALYLWGKRDDGEPRWFDDKGRAAQRGLMRTPIEGGHITSVFGLRKHPILGFFRAHKGIDFGAPMMTPVYAAGDGVVEVAAHGIRGHGTYLQLRHKQGLATGYGHLSAFVDGLKPGDAVRQGQQVAWSGNSGASTGPHLHYEVIVDGAQVDPLSYTDASAGSALVLTGDELEKFLVERRRIDSLRLP